MDKTKKRRIFIAVIAIVLLSLFFARNLINRGSVLINAEVPYTVEIFSEGEFTCNEDPCEIKHKSGLVDLLIRRNGYRSLFTEVEVKIWRTTEISPRILPLPKLLTATELPQGTSQIKYRLVPDEINGMQKLILADDPNQLPIIYFPKALESYKILPSENFVLIVDNDDLYKIDVRGNTREKITLKLPKVFTAKWSLDGNYLLFSQSENGRVKLLDLANSTIKDLKFTSTIDQLAWIFDERLVFVTDQDMINEGVANGYADVITLVESISSKYTFGTYHPQQDIYTKIESFDEIEEMPRELTPTLNGNELYFRSGDTIFKIFLEKF